MTPSTFDFDDVVVVPTVSLNPKKAKKKMKKAIRKEEEMAAQPAPVQVPEQPKPKPSMKIDLPKVTPAASKTKFGSAGRSEEALPPWQARLLEAPWKKNINGASSPAKKEKQDFEDQSTDAGSNASTPRSELSTPESHKTGSDSPLFFSKPVLEGMKKKSWFELTEEDEDDFLPLNFMGTK